MKFLTWLDIERCLRQNTNNYSSMPTGILSIQCFYDGIEIGVQNGKEKQADEFLKTNFKEWYDEKNREISLDFEDEKLPVEFISGQGPFRREKPANPLWQEVIYAPYSEKAGDNENEKDPDEFATPITAFHSFKGGVGRTTILMCYVLALIERAITKEKCRILIIDSDIEAPGITYWFNKLKKTNVSFIHYLEATHYPSQSGSKMTAFFANELKKTSITEGNCEIFILPTFIEEAQLLDTPILPENIVKGPNGPWHYVNAIQELGKRLEADHVFMDLRAGLSEISSPLLFDPRVEKFIVTTIAEQSVTGTGLILTQLSKMMSRFNSNEERDFQYLIPNIILTMLTDDLKKTSDFEEALSTLNEKFDLNSYEINQSDFGRLPIIEFPFNPNIMSLSSWNDVQNKLNHSSVISKDIREWAESRVIESTGKNEYDAQDSQIKNLYETCMKYEFAEKGENVDFLTTEAITNMAKMFKDEPPRIACIGAKGAGKTFCYLQIVRSKFWTEFVKKVTGPVTVTTDKGHLFPLLQTSNLGKAAQKDTKAAREIVWKKIGAKGLLLPQDYVDLINKEIKNGSSYDTSDWTSFWVGLFAAAINIKLENMNIQNLNHFLESKKIHLTFLMDGLEDIFPSIISNKTQQNALKALLDLPNRISELRTPRLGIIVFVRKDFIKYCFVQNRAQFEALYEPYVLSWDATSFLKLVYWICAQSKIGEFSQSSLSKIRIDDILKQLEYLWGKKLGRDNSNEANTARWVYAALTDFKGKIQARDIVRILLHASKLTIEKPGQVKFSTWRDSRLLPPVAIKRSLEPCSQKKIKEAKEEYPEFKKWVERFETEYKEKDRVVPFTAEQYGIKPAVTEMLRDMGIIVEAKDSSDGISKFYMPEIYRTGLQFTMEKGARPRVLALKRMALGKDLF